MHAIQLAELAATFAGYSTDLLALKCAPGRRAGQHYWLEARYRHDYWSSKLAAHRQDLQYLSVANRKKSWLQIIPIIEEILISEPLARSIAYHGRLLSERTIDNDLLALSQSVLSSHIEARHRCLHLIVFGEGLAVEHSKRLNGLRRAMEQFSDGLLSVLQPIGPPDPYSFDPLAVHREQDTWQRTISSGWSPKRFYLAGLRAAIATAFDRRIAENSPSGSSNAKLHQAVLEFLPIDFFDSYGLPLSVATAQLRVESPESSATAEVLSQMSAAPLSFLFEPNRPKPRSASAEQPRW